MKIRPHDISPEGADNGSVLQLDENGVPIWGDAPAGTGGGGGGSVSGGLVLIGQKNLSGLTTFEFADIPQTFTGLRLVFVGGTTTGTYAGHELTVNGLTTTIYNSQRFYVNSGQFSGAATDRFLDKNFLLASDLQSTSGSTIRFEFPNYASSTQDKVVDFNARQPDVDNRNTYMIQGNGVIKLLAPITKITYRLASETYSPGSIAYLYGLPSSSGGGGGGGSSSGIPLEATATGPSGLVSSLIKHRYWRIYSTSATGPETYISISNLEFRDTIGQIKQATGGTASASSLYQSGYEADKAFDNNDSTTYISSSALPNWLAYDFGTPVAVAQVAIRNRDGYPGQTPKNFVVQYSDNGTAWFDEWTDVTDFSAAGTKLFTNPKAAAASTNRYPTTLVALNDVADTAPTDGQALVWDDTLKVWAPETVIATGGGSSNGTALAVGSYEYTENPIDFTVDGITWGDEFKNPNLNPVWQWVNKTPAAGVEYSALIIDDGLHLTANAPLTNWNWGGIHRPMPAGDFDIVAKVTLDGIQAQYNSIALAIYNSTSGRFITASFHNRDTGFYYTAWNRWNSMTSLSTDNAYRTAKNSGYLRMTRVGNVVTHRFSETGRVWTKVGPDETTTDWIGDFDRIGLFIKSENATYPVNARVDWIRDYGTRGIRTASPTFGLGGESTRIKSSKWRVRSQRHYGNTFAVGELRFLDANGANLCTGGTPIASSVYSAAYPASKAFDGSTGADNGWYAANGKKDGEWIGYEFATSVAPESVSIASFTAYPTDTSASMGIDYWNGTGWTEIGLVDWDGWANGVFQTRSIPSQVVGGGTSVTAPAQIKLGTMSTARGALAVNMSFDNNRGLVFDYAANGGQRYGAITRPVLGDEQITIRIVNASRSGNPSFGIGVLEGTGTAKIDMIGDTWNNGVYWERTYSNSGGSSGSWAADAGTSNGPYQLWLRLIYKQASNTTLMQQSADGVHWNQVASNTSYMTPAEIGLFFRDYGSTNGQTCGGVISYFEDVRQGIRWSRTEGYDPATGSGLAVSKGLGVIAAASILANGTGYLSNLSVVKQSVGNYRFTFNQPRANANYSIMVTGREAEGSSAGTGVLRQNGAKTAAYFDVYFYDDTANNFTARDPFGMDITVTADDAVGGTAHTGGTAFPTTPVVGSKFFHTDRGMEYFWNGTMWLSTQIYTHNFPSYTNTSDAVWGNSYTQTNGIPWKTVYGIFVERFESHMLRTGGATSIVFSAGTNPAWAGDTTHTYDEAQGSPTHRHKSTEVRKVYPSDSVSLNVSLNLTAYGVYDMWMHYRLVG